MSWPGHVWDQLKNLSVDELIRALHRDGWHLARSRGAILVYEHFDGRRVSVHYHPRKTYSPGLLKDLLRDTGWTESDLRRLKLIK